MLPSKLIAFQITFIRQNKVCVVKHICRSDAPAGEILDSLDDVYDLQPGQEVLAAQIIRLERLQDPESSTINHKET